MNTPRYFHPHTHAASIRWFWQAALGALAGAQQAERDGLVLHYNQAKGWIEVSDAGTGALLMCVHAEGIGVYADTAGAWYGALGAWLKASPQSTRIPASEEARPAAAPGLPAEEVAARRAAQTAAYLEVERMFRQAKPDRWPSGRFRTMGGRA